MTDMKDKCAIVTGASSGIGRETARLLAGQGAAVVLSARRANLLDELVGEITAAGGRAVAVAGDVADETHAQALVEAAVGRFGGLDMAFNNAGSIGAMGDVAEMATADWQSVMDINLTSAFLAAKYQIPALRARGGGAMLFTSSFVGATVGMPGMAAYASAKAGVIGLAKTLAAQHGPEGIRVNALLPGGTDTAMADEFIDGPETQAFVEGLHALKRTARPEEIARTAIFLLSDAASFVTGAALLADGGVSITRT